MITKVLRRLENSFYFRDIVLIIAMYGAKTCFQTAYRYKPPLLASLANNTLLLVFVFNLQNL